MPEPWHIEPGEQRSRKKLHTQYGGTRQGGIGPSAQSPNVFVFSDPAVGIAHGYYDGWKSDGCFHYTGEGQRGDQRMISGNAAILNHKQDGRSLRVFDGVRGVVRYMGEFEIDPQAPFYHSDAPETNQGPIRKVIVFRLRPLNSPPGEPNPEELILADKTELQKIPPEETTTESFFVDPSREPYQAERAEAALVQRYRQYLQGKGHLVYRHRIHPKGELKPLLTDLYDETEEVLIEAKGSVSREAIRMAIGQLADYGRFLPGARRSLLCPERPRDDLMLLLQSEGIEVVWEHEGGFVSSS